MTAEDRNRIIELIREHMTDTRPDPSDQDCIDYALNCAADKLKDQPKPRHPRNKW